MTDHFLPRFVESQSENSSVVNTRCVASNRTDGGHERADKFCNILAYQPGGDTKNRLSVTMPTLPHLHCKDKYSGDTANERSYLNANVRFGIDTISLTHTSNQAHVREMSYPQVCFKRGRLALPFGCD